MLKAYWLMAGAMIPGSSCPKCPSVLKQNIEPLAAPNEHASMLAGLYECVSEGSTLPVRQGRQVEKH